MADGDERLGGVWQHGSWALALGLAAIACVSFYAKGRADGELEAGRRYEKQADAWADAFAAQQGPEDEPGGGGE